MKNKLRVAKKTMIIYSTVIQTVGLLRTVIYLFFQTMKLHMNRHLNRQNKWFLTIKNQRLKNARNAFTNKSRLKKLKRYVSIFFDCLFLCIKLLRKNCSTNLMLLTNFHEWECGHLIIVFKQFSLWLPPMIDCFYYFDVLLIHLFVEFILLSVDVSVLLTRHKYQ